MDSHTFPKISPKMWRARIKRSVSMMMTKLVGRKKRPNKSYTYKSYTSYTYKKEPWFAAMPDALVRTIERRFGWHLLLAHHAPQTAGFKAWWTWCVKQVRRFQPLSRPQSSLSTHLKCMQYDIRVSNLYMKFISTSCEILRKRRARWLRCERSVIISWIDIKSKDLATSASDMRWVGDSVETWTWLSLPRVAW